MLAGKVEVQLVDLGSGSPQLLTEAVVRTSWVNPIPFGLRLPPDIKLEGRKLAVDARLALGSSTLFRLKAPFGKTTNAPPNPLGEPTAA